MRTAFDIHFTTSQIWYGYFEMSTNHTLIHSLPTKHTFKQNPKESKHSSYGAIFLKILYCILPDLYQQYGSSNINIII